MLLLTIAAGVCLGLLAFCLILAYAKFLVNLIVWMALASTAMIILGLLVWLIAPYWDWIASFGALWFWAAFGLWAVGAMIYRYVKDDDRPPQIKDN